MYPKEEKNNKKQNYFLVDEFKERNKIKTQSKWVNQTIEDEKKRYLEAIDNQSKQTYAEINKEAKKLEKALEQQDADSIKEMLKDIKL